MAEKYTGKHRTGEGEKSTSEKITGKRDDASKSQHRATGETTEDLSKKVAGSDLPPRDAGI